jgi:serine/threonine protein kinase
LVSEIRNLLILNGHPCISPIQDVSLPLGQYPRKIARTVMDLGSLDRVLVSARSGRLHSFWTHTTIATVIAAIALGMRHIHALHTIHGDLKPQNILIGRTGRAQITDLGVLKFEKLHIIKKRKKTAGPMYVPPDVNPLTSAADVYCFGFLLYEILIGPPQIDESASVPELVMGTMRGKRPVIPGTVDGWIRSLIERCWSGNPGDRPSFEQIIGELGGRRFRVYEDVDMEEVQVLCREVEEWEAEHPIKGPSPFSAFW